MAVPAMEGEQEGGSWTFDLVEEKLLEAWGYLMRMPDAERAWLKSCERSAMPAVLRSARAGDYLETRPARAGLRSVEVDLVDQVLIGDAAWIEWVMERDRPLVAAVMRVMGRARSGFGWSDVAAEMQWVAGPDALRMRYSRAVTRIAVKLDASKVAVF